MNLASLFYPSSDRTVLLMAAILIAGSSLIVPCPSVIAQCRLPHHTSECFFTRGQRRNHGCVGRDSA